MNQSLQTRLRETLKQELDARKKKNPRYSLRRFASLLGIDYSFLSKFLRDQKEIGPQYILMIRKNLKLDKELEQEIDKIFSTNPEGPFCEVKDEGILTEWYHYPIFEYLRVRKKAVSIKSLAKQLGIPEEECLACIEKMLKVGLLQPEGDGYVANFNYLSNIRNSDVMRKTQKGFLQKSLESMDTMTPEKRTQMALTVAFDSSQLALFTAEFQKFQRRLNRKAERGIKINSVYQLQISFFPLVVFDE